MSDGTCPPRVKLLALLATGEYVPHLEVCEECAAFAAAASEAVTVFSDRNEVERAVAAQIDAILAETLPRHLCSAIVAAPDLRRSVVIRDLLRRADEMYGSNSRLALDLTTAAVMVCDAMVASGQPPSMDLRFTTLKEHSIALHRMGNPGESLSVINRAWPIAMQTSEPQRDRAILSLCGAIVYAEPDIGKFEEAIELAETAAAVLDVYGDERRAIIARQTKAYVLLVTNRFDAALPLLWSITLDLDAAAGESRDAAIAHAQLALCLVGVGAYDDAVEHASMAESLHLSRAGITDAARVAHVRARAVAALGRFSEVRAEFNRTADIVFEAKLFDVWSIMRLEYVAAALADDASADVRVELESVVRVCMTLSARESTERQRYAAEALDHLRQLAIRDALTFEAADHVRAFVARNASRPPVRFVAPPGAFLM